MTTNKSVTSRLRTLLDLVTTAVVLIAAGVFLWNSILRGSRSAPTGATSIPIPAEPVPLAKAPRVGSPEAKVALVEFADFQCPYCGRFAKDTLPEIKAKYIDTGKVIFVFRHNPLTQIHSRAEATAQAAECAARQGKLWELHARLFEDPKKLEETDVLGYAADAGLDVYSFRACLASSPTERVREDAELAKTLKLGGTPVFLVGRLAPDRRVRVSEMLVGARATADFIAALDRVLKGTGVAD